MVTVNGLVKVVVSMDKWGVIFDWDGVIVRSAELHDEAWRRLAARLGRHIPPDFFIRSFGMKNQSAIRELLKWTDDPAELDRLSEEKESEFRELVRNYGIRPVEGAETLIRTLKDRGIPYAVGSSTPRKNIQCVIEVLGWHGLFPVLVTAEEVKRGKPDPEVFIIAAQRLNLPPEHCIVIEDAPVGIEAAKKGGMKVIGFAGTHPKERLFGADIVVADLQELTLDRLRSLFYAVKEA